MPIDKKITELPVATSISGSDISVLVNNNTDYQYTFTSLLQYLQANLTTGANISFGTTLPQNTSGKNGDIFVNTTTNSFAQKLSNTWNIVYALPASGGLDGTLLYGNGLPGSTTGKDLDSYIDTLTGIFYKKSSGTWGQVFSMASGPVGPRGNSLLNGTTDPSSSTGTNGDFYLNTTTKYIFGPKTSGIWPAGTSLAPMVPNTILGGTINPSSGVGNNGDYYLNTTTYFLFGPKDSGAWPTGIPIIGAGIAPGGTAGQILAKASNFNFDTLWNDLSFANVSGSPTSNAALNAVLSALLPYEGANNDVDLGNYTISSAGFFTKNNGTAYIGIGGNQINSVGGSLQLDADGSLILNSKAGYGGLSINFSDADGLINIQPYEIGTGGLTGSGSYTQYLVFPQRILSSNVTWNLPNNSGTLALLSDISTGYVPYTGATSNLDLNTHSLEFTRSDGGDPGGGYIGSGAVALSITAYGRNGIRMIAKDGSTVASFNWTDSSADNPGVFFYKPVSIYQTLSDSYDPTDNVLIQHNPSASGSHGEVFKLPLSSFARTTDLTGYLPLTGGVLTGDVQQGALPVNGNSLINKSYVDNLVTGLSWKQEVRAATTVNITLSGTQTVDGVALSASDRVLVKNQTSAVNNGIYLVAAGAWTRTTDADTSAEIGSAAILVRNGTTQKNTQWTCTNSTDPVIGTDAITFGQISGAGTYINGTGISLVSNVFSLDLTYADARYVKFTGSGFNVDLTGRQLTADSITTNTAIVNGPLSVTGNVTFSSIGTTAQTQASGYGCAIVTASGQVGLEAVHTNIIYTQNGFNGRLYWDNLTANRDVRLPDGTGTLALISDLSGGYLPLTGGSLTGDLSTSGHVTAAQLITTINGGEAVNITGGIISAVAGTLPRNISFTGAGLELNTYDGGVIDVKVNGDSQLSVSNNAGTNSFLHNSWTADGTFKVTTAPASPTDVVRLADLTAGYAPVSGSSSYIQNLNNYTTPQPSTNISIDTKMGIVDGSIDIITDYDRSSGASISTHWKYAIAVTTDPTATNTSGTHGFSDMTVFSNNNDGRAWNSFDARGSIIGSGNNNHSVAFQDGTTYLSTGTQTNMYTLLSAPTIQAGTVTTRKAIRIQNATLSGGATLGTQTAIAIDALTSGGVNYSIYSAGTQSMHHEGDINLFETTGTIGSGRYLRFEAGSASPVASLQSVYQSTTQGDLVFNARYTTGTSDAATKEVFRVVGGATPGTMTTGNSLLSGNINYTNDLSATSFYIQPNAATGTSGAFVLRSNVNEANDTTGGAAIQIYPDGGASNNNGGRININAYGQGTGPNANSIRFVTRSGTNAATERGRFASDGGFAIGTAINTTVAFLTLAAATTARAAIHFNSGAAPTTPSNGDFWSTSTALFYNNGSTQQLAFLASPTFTGTPAGPTAAAGTNTTQLATTAHVFAERSNTLTLTNKTIGDKLRLSTGANASLGSATLAAGTITVNTTSVSAGSIIFFTRTVTGGVAGTLSYTIAAGTSFTINSSSSTDTSTIGYIIIN